MGLNQVRRASRLGAGLAAAAAVALLVTACSTSGTSSSSSNASASSSSSAVASAAATTPASTAGEVTNYLTYTGGTSGAANKSLSPVTIGFVNDQGGVVNSYPYVSDGVQAAVTYVNDYLGGVDGHPLQVSSCYIATAEEEGRTCGLQMVDNSKIPLVIFGSVSTGDQSFIAIDNGKTPVIEANALGFADPTAKNFYIYDGSSFTSLGGAAAYVKMAHLKTVAVVYPSSSATAGAAEAIESSLKAAGATVKEVGYDPTSTDITAAMVAAGASTADLVVPVAATTSQCVASAKALDSLGVTGSKVLTFSSVCFTNAVASAVGSTPDWLLSSSQALPTITTEPDIEAYDADIEKVGVSAATAEQFDTSTGWADVMTAVKFLNAAGGASATATTVAAQAKAFTGPMALGNATDNCGVNPQQAALCGDQIRIFQYLGGDNWKSLSGWLTPPGA